MAGSGTALADPPADGERVLVALSGGVDSAVAALREREAGRDVVAVTLKLWADQRTDGEQSCCSPEAVLGARRLAHSLGIPHLTLDLEREFRAGVVGPFLRGYAEGRTPNPCVLCNGELRIDAMIALADRLGAAKLVTGHYARLADDGLGPLLAGAADGAKDQTYMLSGPAAGVPRAPALPARRADQARGPGARARGPAWRSPDAPRARTSASWPARASESSCAATPGSRIARARSWIARAAASGEHHGHHNFTVGQRRGLGVGGGEPLYVLATDAAANRVVAGLTRRARDAPGSDPGREAPPARRAGRRGAAPLPLAPPGVPGRGRTASDEAIVALAEPVDRVAPGQVACLLDGDLVVGHGTIV